MQGTHQYRAGSVLSDTTESTAAAWAAQALPKPSAKPVTRRTFVGVLPAGATVLTLSAACGTAGTGQPGGQPAPAKLSGTLHLMDWELGTGPAQDRWAKTVARFKEKYPGVAIEEDRSNLFWQKLPAVVAAGTPPDYAVLRRQAEFPALAGKETVRPLDPYLAKSTVLKKDDFYARTVAMNSIGGKLLALPNTLNLYVLYYNKNLFAQQGVKLPTMEWDYNDFDEAAQKLTKKAGDQFQQAGVDMPTWWIIHYLGSRDAGYWQGGLTDKSGCSRVNYDKPEVIAGYEWWQKHYCRLKTTEADNKDKATAFERGNAAMLLSWIRMGELNDKIGTQFEWDVTLAPLADKKKPRVQTIIGSGAVIFKEAKQPDMAWAFMEFLNDPQFLLEQVKTEGALSVYANRRIMESKEYQASKTPPADKQTMVKGLEAGKFFPEASWEMRAMGVESPPTDIGKAVSCEAAPRDVLPAGAAAINAALKQAGAGC